VTPAARPAPAHDGAPGDAPAEEPPHDVFATEDQFVLTADLPGAGEADLRWTLAEGALTVETPAPRRRRLVAPCPAWLTAEALSVRLANGVLEMTAERRP
jgi:HSP20 family molecular chaperone IbpA